MNIGLLFIPLTHYLFLDIINSSHTQSSIRTQTHTFAIASYLISDFGDRGAALLEFEFPAKFSARRFCMVTVNSDGKRQMKMQLNKTRTD